MPFRKKISSFLAESNLIEGYDYKPNEYLRAFDEKDVSPHPLMWGYQPRNSVTAWKYLENRFQWAHLFENDIFLLHEKQMRGHLHESDLGIYRKCGVRVGSYIVPPHGKIKPLMTQFIKRFAEGNTDPLTMHYEFEKIHPFVDGNGRVGRLLWAWDLLRRGKQVHPILDHFDGKNFLEKRQEYYDALGKHHYSS